MERVAAYIDGFNLHYGMRDAYGHKYAWLDLEKRCESLLRSNQELVSVKYFTARVRTTGAAQRQGVYLDALKAATTVEAIFGRLQVNDVRCKKCGQTYQKTEEKRTDVAIASHLVADAYADRFDAALLVSGDSDMGPPVEMVSATPHRRVIAAFPPKRKSGELRRLAGAAIDISENSLRRAQLPDPVVLGSGYPLVRPAGWV